jgi:hypothetical protein
VGGVAGSDQTTSNAMTTVAAMMSNVFLSIRIPVVLLPSRLLHSFPPKADTLTGGADVRQVIPRSSRQHKSGH